MKIGIIGSRSAEARSFESVLENLPAGCSEIVSGGAAGIDQLAQQVAEQLQIKLTVFRPNYDHYGKRAPLERNLEIIQYADFILAFWDFQSAGTRFVITESIRLHKPVRIIGV